MDSSIRDPASDVLVRPANRLEYIWAALVLAIAGWFYGWTATSGANPLSSNLQADDLYNRLADGFLAGQLSFLEKPNPALENLADPWDPAQNSGLCPFHDVSYYRGKYYLYFGPAPAVSLLAPWKALTGSYMGENLAAAIFAWLGAAASIGLVIVLKRRHFPLLGSWVVGLCFIGVSFGNFALVLLRRPVFYELAISAAFAFVMVALLCVAIALGDGPRRRLWLAAAGVAYGLTLASRPNYLFGAVVLAVPFFSAWRILHKKAALDLRNVLRDVAVTAIPFLGILVLLLFYNYKRFDSFFEFGQHYQLSGLNPQKDLVTTFDYMPVNLWFYFFANAQLTAYFPFFDVIHMPWFQFPAGYTGEEDVYGLCNMPFYWAAFLLIYSWRDARVMEPAWLRDFSLGVLTLFVCNLLVIGRIGGAANRYMVDLFPALLPLACVGVFWIELTAGTTLRRLAARILWIGALTYTTIFNIFVSLNHNDLLQHYNPSVYRRLAHGFDRISIFLGETSPSKIGPLHLRLKFPVDRNAQVQPLIVTGLSFKADFIYLFYTDDSHIQIGFEHTSYGGALSDPPVEIDYAVEHTLDIEMGSLYPPVEHPFYDNLPSAEIARLKRTLRIKLDGHEILAGMYNFYDSSPGDVSVGRNPVSDAFGRRFTGQILDVSRLPVASRD